MSQKLVAVGLLVWTNRFNGNTFNGSGRISEHLIVNRNIQNHVCCKRQKSIYTTWPLFSFTYLHENSWFHTTFIHKNYFGHFYNLLISKFEKLTTYLNLTFIICCIKRGSGISLKKNRQTTNAKLYHVTMSLISLCTLYLQKIDSFKRALSITIISDTLCALTEVKFLWN